MKKIKVVILLIIFNLISLSCVSINQTSSVVINELPFPNSDQYDSVIKVNGELIVLVNDGKRGGLKSYAKEGDGMFTDFFLEYENVECSSIDRYGAYETLPDGRLQVWKRCIGDTGGMTFLLAYDWETHQLEEITGPLPLGSLGASWNPEQKKAIGYLDSKFATKTLYWIYPAYFEALDLEIKDGNRSWNLKDDFPKFNASDRGESGTTGRASWSPDGKQIAFFASPNAIGKTGFSRFGVEYYLYLMNPETLEYVVVAEDIYSPFVLEWSPDSLYIAFIGKRGFFRQNGLWLYSTKTNKISNISEGIFSGLVWRSNMSVIAIQCEEISVCRQVVQLDITQLVE